tara:strand:+ start:720 stop:881 length:162 start_codon:yes stop_codon:yes gene_type:complete
MDKQYLKNFKDGVFDAVIYGVQSEKSPRPDGYKQGYDFGLTLWAYEREDAKEA